MLKIGLTGGIGSGKSTVARVFELLGIPVYYADDAAKRLMQEDPLLVASITSIFGTEVYRDGVLDRKYLSAAVFQDREKLDQLNRLVHPATIQDAAEWMKRQQAPYALKEAALIFESGSHKELDYVIGVSAPFSLRTHRAMQRDQVSRETVLSRMKNQIEETVKMKLCDFVIVNDEQQLVLPQVTALHEKLVSLSLNK
jgi:dephospho-CoA kinase